MQLPEGITRLTGLRALALSSNRLWQVRSCPSVAGVWCGLAGRLQREWLGYPRAQASAAAPGVAPCAARARRLSPPPACRQLPTAIGAMVSLRLLDVSHNMLTKLPSSVGDLDALRSLKVRARAAADAGLGAGRLQPPIASRHQCPATPSQQRYRCCDGVTSVRGALESLISAPPPTDSNHWRLHRPLPQVTHNRLTCLPPGVAQLGGLEELHMADNAVEVRGQTLSNAVKRDQTPLLCWQLLF